MTVETKFSGEGERQMRKHGVSRCRLGCRIHLGINAETRKVRAAARQRPAFDKLTLLSCVRSFAGFLVSWFQERSILSPMQTALADCARRYGDRFERWETTSADRPDPIPYLPGQDRVADFAERFGPPLPRSRPVTVSRGAVAISHILKKCRRRVIPTSRVTAWIGAAMAMIEGSVTRAFRLAPALAQVMVDKHSADLDWMAERFQPDRKAALAIPLRLSETANDGITSEAQLVDIALSRLPVLLARLPGFKPPKSDRPTALWAAVDGVFRRAGLALEGDQPQGATQ